MPQQSIGTRPLRIGYLSPDLRNHPIGRLIHPVLKHHDRTKFEVVVFHDSDAKGIVTQQLRSLVDEWHDVHGKSDDELVTFVRSLNIDILVEMGGHFGNNRLLAFARRMAPVQVSGFAYCGTTGVPNIDYRLTDSFSDPVGQADRLHTERLVRLPDCCWCYRPFEPMPAVRPLPASQNGYVTFGSLNNAIKISPGCVATWAAILSRVKNSKLLLLCRKDIEPRLRQLFEDAYVGSETLEFIPPVSRHQYLKAYRRLDVALDPFPFNGDNTTCDALWMGVPVISLVGSTFAARRGLSHLINVGHPEWAATGRDSYIDIACEAVADLKRLTTIRQSLRDDFERSVLGDGPRYLRAP